MADDIKTKKPQKTEQETKEIINKAKKKGIKVERPKPTKPKEEKNKPKPKEEKKKTALLISQLINFLVSTIYYEKHQRMSRWYPLLKLENKSIVSVTIKD